MDCLCGAAWCFVSSFGLCSCQKHFLLCRDKLILQKEKQAEYTALHNNNIKNILSNMSHQMYPLSLPWKCKVESTLKHTQNTKRIKRQTYKCVEYCDRLPDSLDTKHSHISKTNPTHTYINTVMTQKAHNKKIQVIPFVPTTSTIS